MEGPDEEVLLSPIAGWETATIPTYGVGLLRIMYYVSPSERIEQAHKSPRFAFQPDELRKLAARLTALADEAESLSAPDQTVPRN